MFSIYIKMKKEGIRIEKRGINFLYLNQFIRGSAFSLVGIFIPIYLLTLGFSLTSIFIYFLIFHLATFIFTPIALILSKRVGYKVIFLSSVIIMIFFLILLQLLDKISISYVIIATIGGIENAFYFIPLHAFFTRLSEDLKRGTQLSNYSSLGQLAGLFSPLIGGFIILRFGFSSLFTVVIVLLSISIIPLFYLENTKPNTIITLRGVKKLANNHKRFFLGTIAKDFLGEINEIVWPIFVYITLVKVLSVGLAGTLVAGGSILFTLFVGRFYDKKNKYLFLKIGGALFAVLWIMRIYLDTPLFIFASSMFAGFFAIMINIPFGAIFYDKAAKEKDFDEFIVVREIPTVIARTTLWIFMILLINKFVFAFTLASIASLFFLLYTLKLKIFKNKTRKN